MWIHYERLHNHNKAKHNKTVCIFIGLYCISSGWDNQHTVWIVMENGQLQYRIPKFGTNHSVSAPVEDVIILRRKFFFITAQHLISFASRWRWLAQMWILNKFLQTAWQIDILTNWRHKADHWKHDDTICSVYQIRGYVAGSSEKFQMDVFTMLGSKLNNLSERGPWQ